MQKQSLKIAWYISALLSITSVVSAITYSLYSNLEPNTAIKFYDSGNIYSEDFTNKQITDEIITDKIELIVNGKLQKTKNRTIDALAIKISQIENDFLFLSKQTEGLRQAINPQNPEEILTIARISDRLNDVSKNFIDFKDQISAHQKLFQDSIHREIKTFNSATTLIIVALIPLILNFVYNIWKDNRNSTNEPTAENDN